MRIGTVATDEHRWNNAFANTRNPGEFDGVFDNANFLDLIRDFPRSSLASSSLP
jgi:hypothetical protein